MDKITVYVIAYNEENRIEAVLKSLRYFEHVLVINKSSTDNTETIARSNGANVITVPYTNQDTKEMFDIIISEARKNKSEWVLAFVCSDICHVNLYSELNRAINGYAKDYDVVGVPFIIYSMGMTGKNTYYGGLKYKNLLVKTESMEYTDIIHKLYIKEGSKEIKMNIDNKSIAIYHFTHENIEMVMDRHFRYAQTVAQNRKKSGRSKERELRSCRNEVLRHTFDYFRKGIYKKKWDGMAQYFMLLMYYSMIYIYTYFDNLKEKEIVQQYSDMKMKLIKGEDV